MRKLVIIGASGFGREIAWVVERINRVSPTFDFLGFCDDAEEQRRGEWGGIPLLGLVEGVAARLGRVAFHCAIGNNRARQAVTMRAIAAGLEPATLVDPSAVIAPDAEVGKGCYIGIGSVVSTETQLGLGIIVNHHVTVGHGVRIGDFAQLCPGVCVSGGCEIGEGALFGTLAGTIPLKRVGAWATVGAGMVSLRDVEADTTMIRLRG
jgi:sugar O-acyltransferase (sialic acid O-acetyltransferase NeuD family)